MHKEGITEVAFGDGADGRQCKGGRGGGRRSRHRRRRQTAQEAGHNSREHRAGALLKRKKKEKTKTSKSWNNFACSSSSSERKSPKGENINIAGKSAQGSSSSCLPAGNFSRLKRENSVTMETRTWIERKRRSNNKPKDRSDTNSRIRTPNLQEHSQTKGTKWTRSSLSSTS